MFGGRGTPANIGGMAPGANLGGGNLTGGGTTGLIQGPEQGVTRFLRESRDGRDFVGRNRQDIKSFIGAQQALAVGQVRSNTEGLRLNSAAANRRINQPIPPQSAKGMYYPRLDLGSLSSDLAEQSSAFTDRDENMDQGNRDNGVTSEISGRTTASFELNADSRLLARVQRIAGARVQVTLQGATAILSGEATSQRDAELAAQVLQFEPGIDRVESRLR